MANLYDFTQNKRSFDGFIPGQAATQPVPRNIGALHEFLVRYVTSSVGGATEANMLLEIDSIEILINELDWTKISLATLFLLEKFYGETVEDGMIPLAFAQHSRRRIAGAEATSFITDAHPEMKVRLNLLDNGQTCSAVTYLTTEGIGAQGREVAKVAPHAVARPILKVKDFVHNIISSGDVANRMEHQNAGQRIRGFHFVGSNITKIVANYNDQERWAWNHKDLLDRKLTRGGFVPQANTWHFVPECFSGSVQAGIDLKNGDVMDRLDFEIYTSDQTDIQVIVEEYETPELRLVSSQSAAA